MFTQHPLLIISPLEIAPTINIHMRFGCANGYVAVPQDHPWYGAGYGDLPVEVHGGLTFADHATLFGVPYWMLGFDTWHMDDTPERWPIKQVFGETMRLWKEVKEYGEKAKVLSP